MPGIGSNVLLLNTSRFFERFLVPRRIAQFVISLAVSRDRRLPATRQEFVRLLEDETDTFGGKFTRDDLTASVCVHTRIMCIFDSSLILRYPKSKRRWMNTSAGRSSAGSRLLVPSYRIQTCLRPGRSARQSGIVSIIVPPTYHNWQA